MTLKENNSTHPNSSWQIDFLERNALEAGYLTKAAQLFDPILHSQKLNYGFKMVSDEKNRLSQAGSTGNSVFYSSCI